MLAPISVCMCAKLLQSYLPLCDSMNYSPPGSSVRGSLQARTLEWVATPSSRGSSPPKDQAHGSYISYVSRWVLYTSASWEGEKAMAPTPVRLPGKSHGWRSLVGCSPWGRSESDTTERLHFHFPVSCIGEGNGNPLQCSCLENPRDGGAWWAAIYGVAQSQT